jgi:hypothetical protein
MTGKQVRQTVGVAAAAAIIALAVWGEQILTAFSVNQAPALPYLSAGEAPCTAESVTTVDSDRITGYGPLCHTQKKPGVRHGKLIIEGIDVTLGTSIAEVRQQASLKSGNTSSSNSQLTIHLSRLVPQTRPDGSPANEFPPWKQKTVIYLGSDHGRVSGVYACQNFVSGDYQNRFNPALVTAFGLPNYTDSDGSTLTMEWPNNAVLAISGSPNFARLQMGVEPYSIAQRKDGWWGDVFDELVSLEDRMDMSTARSELAAKYCLTENELGGVMVQMLRAGRQPRAD